MQPIAGLSVIIDRYDALLLDLWGVVHDGTQLYPGVKETLVRLRAAEKKIIFISNAPRRAAKAASVLAQLGIERGWYDDIMTSGELAFRWLAASPSPPAGEGGVGGLATDSKPECVATPYPSPPPQGGREKMYFYIGPPRDADVLNGLDYRRGERVAECGFLLNVGFGSDEQSCDDWSGALAEAAALKLPMLCLNPDMEVVKISGERYPCAGVLALAYERLGGQVRYFGKPYPEIYQACMEWLAVDKTRVLAVGDSVATDIRGAAGFGIDSALVTGGILHLQSESVEQVCGRFRVEPGFVMGGFGW